MARKKTQQGKAFHCDGYYNRGVCDHRGLPDAADVRKRKGWIAAHRLLCLHYGVHDGQICRHCIEWKHLFRGQEPRQILREDNGIGNPS